MESKPQHHNQDMQNSRKTKKRDGEMKSTNFSSLGKPTEATKGNDTWIWTAEQKDKWKEKEDEFVAASKT